MYPFDAVYFMKSRAFFEFHSPTQSVELSDFLFPIRAFKPNVILALPENTKIVGVLAAAIY